MCQFSLFVTSDLLSFFRAIIYRLGSFHKFLLSFSDIQARMRALKSSLAQDTEK